MGLFAFEHVRAPSAAKRLVVLRQELEAEIEAAHQSISAARIKSAA